MTANAQIDRYRKAAQVARWASADAEAGDAGEISAAACDTYMQLLNRPPIDDREILGIMFAGDSLSHIAKELNISYSNAGVRVHRIRRLIKELAEN